MLHNISTFFSSLEHMKFKWKVGNDGSREDMSFMANIPAWCVERLIFSSEILWMDVENMLEVPTLWLWVVNSLFLRFFFIFIKPLSSSTPFRSCQSLCFECKRLSADFCLLLAWSDVTIWNKAAKHPPTHKLLIALVEQQKFLRKQRLLTPSVLLSLSGLPSKNLTMLEHPKGKTLVINTFYNHGSMDTNKFFQHLPASVAFSRSLNSIIKSAYNFLSSQQDHSINNSEKK